MNILLYDRQQICLEQMKHIMDACREVSGSVDWIALPKGVDVIQDAPIESLEYYRDMLDKHIKAYRAYREAENERP